MADAFAIGFLLHCLVQRHGTGTMGKFFGPITLLGFLYWFLGIHSIIQTPYVLGMLSPHWALTLFSSTFGLFNHGCGDFDVTGGEALYADMGHFGRLPIRLGWFIIVLPCFY
jgi:KUP system potassium uptake protein